MKSFSPFFRPGLRAAAYAAFSQLSQSERAVREESQLNVCRDTLEETLLILHPECHLASKLQDALDEVRRRSLAMLSKEKSEQRGSDLGPHQAPHSTSDYCAYKYLDKISCTPDRSYSAPTSNIETTVIEDNNNAIAAPEIRAAKPVNRPAVSNDNIRKPPHAGKKHLLEASMPPAKRRKVGRCHLRLDADVSDISM
ncbi:uncharacterized protein FFB20_10991 [Fusarium fujikuroi]|nr:uncharacterized protein FFB20_10991 [Fusarium fujikuroi]SCO24327.1 uncharacterized protein FFE2_15928 [Fusarium fujikuroi]SCO25548.1 uncharacterized protein FFC1_15582 [Fusarium fujikuroi]SCO54012.1 uncharacterized protein FFNC_15289 [Fusarium fujikuroi]